MAPREAGQRPRPRRLDPNGRSELHFRGSGARRSPDREATDDARRETPPPRAQHRRLVDQQERDCCRLRNRELHGGLLRLAPNGGPDRARARLSDPAFRRRSRRPTEEGHGRGDEADIREPRYPALGRLSVHRVLRSTHAAARCLVAALHERELRSEHFRGLGGGRRVEVARVSSVPEINALLNRRSDLSTFVVHLTKDGDDGTTAHDNLVAILTDNTIEARTPRGWISGLTDAQKRSAKVVCFSETPLEHVY